MKHRFKAQELFALRNEIPVKWLIDVLNPAIKDWCSDSCFQCPCCQSLHTSINPTTNLARCFECRRNFNPIDLVIASRCIDFVQSVAFLRDCRRKLHLEGQKMAKPSSRSPTEPLAVKEILRRIVLSSESEV
jgi:hypothetical protein